MHLPPRVRARRDLSRARPRHSHAHVHARRFRVRPAARTDRSGPGTGTNGQPAAARRRRAARRSRIHRPAWPAARRRPAGLQRYARDQCASLCAQVHWRQGRIAGGARRGKRRSVGAAAGQPIAARRQRARSAGRRARDDHRPRRPVLAAAVRRHGSARGMARCAWRCASAALYRATPRDRTTAPATRPCTRARRGRSPPQRPACTSMLRYWRNLPRAASARRSSRCMSVRAPSIQCKTNDLSLHRMHREWYRIPQETSDAVAATIARGGRIVAVGTTSLRALESAVTDDGLRAGSAETALFVTPGFVSAWSTRFSPISISRSRRC